MQLHARHEFDFFLRSAKLLVGLIMQQASNIVSPLTNNMHKVPFAPLCHPKRAVSYGTGVFEASVGLNDSSNLSILPLHRGKSVSCGSVMMHCPVSLDKENTDLECFCSAPVDLLEKTEDVCFIESSEPVSEEDLGSSTNDSIESEDAWWVRMDLWDQCECEECLDCCLDHNMYDGYFATSKELVKQVDEEEDDSKDANSNAVDESSVEADIDLKKSQDMPVQLAEELILVSLSEVTSSHDAEYENACSESSESTYQLGDLFESNFASDEACCESSPVDESPTNFVEADEEVFPVKRPVKKLGFWRRLFACGCSGQINHE